MSTETEPVLILSFWRSKTRGEPPEIRDRGDGRDPCFSEPPPGKSASRPPRHSGPVRSELRGRSTFWMPASAAVLRNRLGQGNRFAGRLPTRYPELISPNLSCRSHAITEPTTERITPTRARCSGHSQTPPPSNKHADPYRAYEISSQQSQGYMTVYLALAERELRIRRQTTNSLRSFSSSSFIRPLSSF